MVKIKDFNKKEQTKLVAQAWGKIKDFPDEDKVKYINFVIENKYSSGEMFSIFNDMMSIRFKLNMPVSVDKELEKLKAESFEMYKQLQKELLKSRDKAK